MWKLYRLLKSVILDKRPQFVVELTKELDRMLEIEMKLLTSFQLQIDRQTEQMNYELEQYLWFFIDHRQKNWLEWLTTTEFAVNSKIHSANKISLFIVNYGRKMRMGADIRKKKKVAKTMEFAEMMKKV